MQKLLPVNISSVNALSIKNLLFTLDFAADFQLQQNDFKLFTLGQAAINIKISHFENMHRLDPDYLTIFG